MISNYYVSDENNKQAVVRSYDDNVALYISKEDMTLRSVYSLSDDPIDLVIPNNISSTISIKKIRRGCFGSGKFGKVVLSNGIEIDDMAFLSANVDEVVWPDDFHTIPMKCFCDSQIRKITNINHVTQIGSHAFTRSNIQNISWPENCPIVPEGCFSQSQLPNFSATKNIEVIERRAFASAETEIIDLSDACSVYLKPGSLWLLNNNCRVDLPYYVTNDEYIRSKSLFVKE